jgi:hypothetical protein
MTRSRNQHWRKHTQTKQCSECESGGVPGRRQVVDVLWMNSTARHHAHGSRAGAGAGTTLVLPPITEQQQQPLPALHAMSMSPQVPQGPAQAPPPQRQFLNQHRYALIDPSANSVGGSPLPSKTVPPSYARLVGWPACHLVFRPSRI